MTRVYYVRDAPVGAVYAGRPGPLGNPHAVGLCWTCTKREDRSVHHKRGEAVALFRAELPQRLASDPVFAAAVEAARGKALTCWCRDGAECHAKVIAEHLDRAG